MKYKLKLLPVAYRDLRKAKKWYIEIDEALGADFKLKVNAEFDYIQKFPEHYQKKHKELRQANIARFPYSIFYLIEEELKLVVVIGVLSQKQNFERIKKRIDRL